MPRLASLINNQLTGKVTYSSPPALAQYLSIELNAASYNEGQTITATVTTANVANGTTVGYTVTGVSANDLSAGSLTGTITINSNTGAVQFTLAQDLLTEGTDTFLITLASTDSAGTSTGAISDSAPIADTSNDPSATLWLDDNDDPTTVRLVIGANSMQINGVFAANPSVPRRIQGRNSGAQTTIGAITARTASYIEVDDTGNSTSFVIGEQLNLLPQEFALDTFGPNTGVDIYKTKVSNQTGAVLATNQSTVWRVKNSAGTILQSITYAAGEILYGVDVESQGYGPVYFYGYSPFGAGTPANWNNGAAVLNMLIQPGVARLELVQGASTYTAVFN